MTPLRLGFIPLSDCAVLAVAQERGLFRAEGLDVTLSREVSWANLRDKVAIGALDGAQMLAGMPLAASVGIDPVARPLVTAFSLDLNGNAITVSTGLWRRMVAADPEASAQRPMTARALRAVIDDDRRHGRPPLRFAMVYPFATHNYELRYWLAAAGIDPDTDLLLTVVPPPRMVEALERGAIDGFCVGEPWNSAAVRRGRGRIAVTKYEIWNNSPEKVFAVTERFAEERPEVHQALLRALIAAALWTDAHRLDVARLLADERYVGAPEALVAVSLTGHLHLAPDGERAELADFHVFQRYAANFPWTSHAMWLLAQMLRWGQLAAPVDVLAVARRVYRPDLYREAARATGVAAPDVDLKIEGTHAAGWRLEGAAGAIEMGSDLFFDGRTFNPAAIVDYLAGTSVGSRQVSLTALAAHNP
ncbi:MAG: CmpA/NrtA family ABC transporter substrate-binding protein [Candidatus Binatia bacterium]